MSKPPIIFVHGLWLHPVSWEKWEAYFQGLGHNTQSPPWPGDAPTVTETREHADAEANHGVAEVADYFAAVIKKLPEAPVLIGHSFGGLIVQELLGRGIAKAAVAIDPAPIRGVWQLPISALKSSSPVLANPFNLTRSVSLTYDEFKYAFANELDDAEARKLYDTYTIPAPGRPLFEAATASFNPYAQTQVNTHNETRGPLLLISGAADHTVPPLLVKATHKLYKKSPAVTDIQSFAGRGHSLTIDHGWQEVATFISDWIDAKVE